MTCPEFGLVDIVRDFLLADTLTRRLFARFRAGTLRFDEIQELVGDGEGSVLYRLKEHCHALFRPRDRSSGISMPREALFDLAVGSLFHEAMKFRENLYQLTVYGPKVRELRSEAGAEAGEIFREFEKLLAAAAERLEEAAAETEALLAHTRAQFHVLLVAHRENGLVARYLIENASLATEVFGRELDRLLAEIHGDAAHGYRIAARSYLSSGYFGPARVALAEAIARAEGDPALPALAAYAEGMDAYLEGRYGDALRGLERWLERSPDPDEPALADLAHSALSRVGALAEGPEAAAVAASAQALADRVRRRERAEGDAG
ncbi:hypothetical protein MYXO_01682 [Myxococcaceae bacterium]|jgi:tetratricopeptide (TPR) repeat protein|nr:hypothetical protein MYXO_01682 [Myxococcaceae bacterium]